MIQYKAEARAFLEQAGIDPDIFDWSLVEIMANFAHLKVAQINNWTVCPVCCDEHCKLGE